MIDDNDDDTDGDGDDGGDKSTTYGMHIFCPTVEECL